MIRGNQQVVNAFSAREDEISVIGTQNRVPANAAVSKILSRIC